VTKLSEIQRSRAYLAPREWTTLRHGVSGLARAGLFWKLHSTRRIL
jgi:hypothetical protein